MDVICEKTTNLREKINDFSITASFWTWSEGSLWYQAEVILVKWHLRASKSCPDEIKQVGHGYKGKAWKCELLGGYFRKAETQTFDCSSLLIIKKVVFLLLTKHLVAMALRVVRGCANLCTRTWRFRWTVPRYEAPLRIQASERLLQIRWKHWSWQQTKPTQRQQTPHWHGNQKVWSDFSAIGCVFRKNVGIFLRVDEQHVALIQTSMDGSVIEAHINGSLSPEQQQQQQQQAAQVNDTGIHFQSYTAVIHPSRVKGRIYDFLHHTVTSRRAL